MLPDLTIGANLDERVLLQVAGVAPQFEVAGTLEGWQAEIGGLAVGNSRMVLAISAAFAAALLHPAAEESGGLHLFGQSSSGKSNHPAEAALRAG